MSSFESRLALFLNGATPALLDEPHVRLAPADLALVDAEEHRRVAAERGRLERALSKQRWHERHRDSHNERQRQLYHKRCGREVAPPKRAAISSPVTSSAPPCM